MLLLIGIGWFILFSQAERIRLKTLFMRRCTLIRVADCLKKSLFDQR